MLRRFAQFVNILQFLKREKHPRGSKIAVRLSKIWATLKAAGWSLQLYLK